MNETKIKKLFQSQLTKMKLDFDLTFRPLTEEVCPDHDITLFLVGRSERDNHDKTAFIVFFNKELLKTLHAVELKRSIFHEILHMLTWPLIDEHSEAVKHITNKKLVEELVSRTRVSWENVVYTLEKKLFNKLL